MGDTKTSVAENDWRRDEEGGVEGEACGCLRGCLRGGDEVERGCLRGCLRGLRGCLRGGEKEDKCGRWSAITRSGACNVTVRFFTRSQRRAKSLTRAHDGASHRPSRPTSEPTCGFTSMLAFANSSTPTSRNHPTRRRHRGTPPRGVGGAVHGRRHLPVGRSGRTGARPVAATRSRRRLTHALTRAALTPPSPIYKVTFIEGWDSATGVLQQP